MPQDTIINEPRKRVVQKTGGSRVLNILLVIAVVVVGVLFVRAELERRSTQANLEKTSQELEEVKQSTQNNGQEAANEILSKVRKLIDIPVSPAPSVATITDVEALRKTNDFYKNANNGDSLIITENRAILYSFSKNMIIDVVPVQISPSPSVTPFTETNTTPVP